MIQFYCEVEREKKRILTSILMFIWYYTQPLWFLSILNIK